MHIQKDPENGSVTKMISKNIPEQYGNVMMWNINADHTETDAIAFKIAEKIKKGGEIDTFLLQEVTPQAYIEIMGKVNEQLGGKYKLSVSFQAKAEHGVGNQAAFGNLIISTKDIVDSVEASNYPPNEPVKKIIDELNNAVKAAGGEPGQIQIALAFPKEQGGKPQILLNVHANSTQEESRNEQGKRIKKRLDLAKIIKFINENKDKSPYNECDIIMGGDFNADFHQLPRDIYGLRKETDLSPNQWQELENEFGYQHSLLGTSYSANGTKMGVDAVLAFNMAKPPELTPMYSDNLVEKLPAEQRQIVSTNYSKRFGKELPPDSKPKPKEAKPEEQKESKFSSPQSAPFSNTQLKEFCSNNGHTFELKGASGKIILKDNGGEINVIKLATGTEFSIPLSNDEKKQTSQLNSAGGVLGATGMKKVRLEVKNTANEQEQTAILDKMWLSAVTNKITVEGYTPKNQEIINQAPKEVRDALKPAQQEEERASIRPVS